MSSGRNAHTATLLADGRVVVIGGDDIGGLLDTAQLYDPVVGGWGITGEMTNPRIGHSATLLDSGIVLVVGGHSSSGVLGSAEEMLIVPANNLTGTLILPPDWAASREVTVEVVGPSTGAAIDAASLSNDGTSWGGWIPVFEWHPCFDPLDPGLRGLHAVSSSSPTRCQRPDSQGVGRNLGQPGPASRHGTNQQRSPREHFRSCGLGAQCQRRPRDHHRDAVWRQRH